MVLVQVLDAATSRTVGKLLLALKNWLVVVSIGLEVLVLADARRPLVVVLETAKRTWHSTPILVDTKVWSMATSYWKMLAKFGVMEVE